MPDTLAELRRELSTAYRIVANEGILDAFGHISVRHPSNPKRYFLSRSRAPALVEPDDILEYDLDSNPIVPPVTRPYSERVIHGEIFKARPDVNAVCHHHAPSIMPFAISGVPLVPVFHLGAAMGRNAPFWDSRDEFGDTNLLVVKPEEGASLARALGSHSIVLMRRHGATVVGGESARARVPHDLFGEERRASARRAGARQRLAAHARAKPRWRASSTSRPGRSRAPMSTGCGGSPSAKGAANRDAAVRAAEVAARAPIRAQSQSEKRGEVEEKRKSQREKKR